MTYSAKLLVLAVVLAVVAGATAQGGEVQQESDIYAIIPAYFHMGTSTAEYGKLLTSASILGKRLWIVLNPNNGPIADDGSVTFQEYIRFCNKARALGAKILGYVHTTYGTREEAPVLRDIDAWYDYFNLDGIFFDEGSQTPEGFWLYNNAVAYAKVKAAAMSRATPLIFLNPGLVEQHLGHEYAAIADGIVMKEDVAAGVAAYNTPQWVVDLQADAAATAPTATGKPARFAVLGHGMTREASLAMIADAHDRLKARFVYFTDLTGTNPWSALPSYWLDLVIAVAGPSYNPNPSELGLLIPAYINIFGDSAEYDQLVITAQVLGPRAVFVVNPNSGPVSSWGNPADFDAYTKFVVAARAAGAKVLGYVTTSYGMRDKVYPATYRDVDLWFDNFILDGIYFDQMSQNEAMYWSYFNLAHYVKLKASVTPNQPVPLLVLNPGNVDNAAVHERYALNIADIMVVKTNTYEVATTFIAPPWMAKFDSPKFAMLAHSADTFEGLIATARANGVYHIFATNFTDKPGVNTWGHLPTFYADMVAAIAATGPNGVAVTPEQMAALRAKQTVVV